MRIVYMGSPRFAVPPLEALVDAGHTVSLVVTQPDRQAGRGRRLTPPPIAIRAIELGIPIYQPARIRATDALERLRAEAPDVIAVAAYGQILPRAVLDVPTLGCVNVHASLLPRHRGPSPISAALLAGDLLTGVSIMLMDEGMDTGPVLSRAETPIAAADDQVSLGERLAILGARLLVDAIAAWAAGKVGAQPQDASQATRCHLVTRSDGILDWTEPAIGLWRRIRAFAEWPQGFTEWDGRLLRIQNATYDDGLSAEPGLVIPFGARSRSPLAAAIGTGRGVLLPRVVALEGRRPVPIADFLRGYPGLVGARLASAGMMAQG